MNIYEERIAPLFTQTGKNDKELETIIGLPKGIIYNWKSGRSKNFEAYIPQISKYFHISADYLMGIDPSKSPVKDEGEKEATDQKAEGEDAQLAQLIAGFSRLSPQQKSAVLAVIEGYQPSQE
jgi:transcriptional regulator with XRE-family HTH domain